jgi:alpha-1,3-glucosyltransferase
MIMWLPWLSSYNLFMSVVTAIFPFHRGLYQLKVKNICNLKVASFWCISDVFMKWEQNYSLSTLQLICIILTLGSSIVALVPLFMNPTKSVFKLSLFTVSLAFYFFAFHVHEKTIIFPLAMCVLNIK